MSGCLSEIEISSAFSHHLKLLQDAGLLVQRTEGKHHYTSVDKKLVARIAALIPSRLDTAPKRKR